MVSADWKAALRPIGMFAVLGLGGCTQVYDDTKGWANGVEAWFRRDVLESVPAVALEDERQDIAPHGITAASAPTPLTTPAALAAVPDKAPSESGQQEAAPTPAPTAVPVDEAKLYPQTAGKPAGSPADSRKIPAAASMNESGKTQLATTDSDVAASVPEVLLHLSSNGSRKAAEKEWGQLSTAFPGQLDGLDLRIERADLGKKGIFFRVLAGPLRDSAAARKICSQLKEKRQYCALMPAPRPTSIRAKG